MINENTLENEPISVYGNWDVIYVESKRPHSTKYSYQFPISEIDIEIKTEYMNEIQQKLPKIIVIQEGHADENIINFLNTNEYKKIWSEDKIEDNRASVYLKQ